MPWRQSPWWPGRSYVTSVGIDGYYVRLSRRFFLSIWAHHRCRTHIDPEADTRSRDRLLARSGTSQAKIADLFAGLRLYGLLGLGVV